MIFHWWEKRGWRANHHSRRLVLFNNFQKTIEWFFSVCFVEKLQRQTSKWPIVSITAKGYKEVVIAHNRRMLSHKCCRMWRNVSETLFIFYLDAWKWYKARMETHYITRIWKETRFIDRFILTAFMVISSDGRQVDWRDELSRLQRRWA